LSESLTKSNAPTGYVSMPATPLENLPRGPGNLNLKNVPQSNKARDETKTLIQIHVHLKSSNKW